MIKYILKIICILLSLSTNGQPSKDSIQSSKRELITTLKRLSHADILRQFPNIVQSDALIAFTIPCLPPVNYWDGNRVSSNFGWRKHPLNGRFKHHNGVDIAGNNQYIRTTGTGLVEQIDYDNGLGLFVIINHGNSYQSIYGHLASVHVQEGQFLQIGETIGILGNTGHSTGKHLHYAIKKNGQYVSPIEYLTLGLKFLEALSQWK